MNLLARFLIWCVVTITSFIQPPEGDWGDRVYLVVEGVF